MRVGRGDPDGSTYGRTVRETFFAAPDVNGAPRTSSDEAVTECSLIVLIRICELTPPNVYQTALRLRSRTFN